MRVLRRVALALLLTPALAACGSSSSSSTGNGVASKSPEAILTSATNAIESAKSVHVAGSLVSSGSQIGLDLQFVSATGARGVISQGRMSFQIIDVGQYVYISADQSFWRRFAGPGVAQLLQGKWLKAPTSSGNFAPFARLTNLSALFSGLSSNHGTLAKGTTTTINGRDAVPLHDTTKGGTMFVATQGEPYPLEIVKTGSEPGHLTFDRFNETVSLAPPANAIDISQLQSG
jgi:hypothetical protein